MIIQIIGTRMKNCKEFIGINPNIMLDQGSNGMHACSLPMKNCILSIGNEKFPCEDIAKIYTDVDINDLSTSNAYLRAAYNYLHRLLEVNQNIEWKII